MGQVPDRISAMVYNHIKHAADACMLSIYTPVCTALSLYRIEVYILYVFNPQNYHNPTSES